LRAAIARFLGKSKVPSPDYRTKVTTVPAVSHVSAPGKTQWYPPIMVGADTIAARLFDRRLIESAIELMKRLTPDDYTSFLTEYYTDGLRRFGSSWRYADIVTVLLCLSETLEPSSYLEIGVRRGRSVAAVASLRPHCSLFLLDMWVENYAGMENPGADFVHSELARVGHQGTIRFVNGDSHETLPALFAQLPDATFDLITVDGDHETKGAFQDLRDVLPRLNLGGAVVFDDLCHPLHPELAEVWRELVASDQRYSSFTYHDVGYGVGFAIRKH
jgi:predicted O-methyltransferase YrrM